MPLSAELAVQLLDAVSVGVIVFQLEDLDDGDSLTLFYANSTAARLLSMDLGTLLGERLKSVFPPTDAARAERLQTYLQVCRTRAPHDFGVVSHQGRHPVEDTFSLCAWPVLDRAVALVFECVSALRTAEVEARRASIFLEAIIEHIPASVFMKDSDLRFERFNRGAEALTGISRTALLGKSDYDFFPKDQADFFVEKDRQVMRSGTLQDIPEEPIETARGTRWLHTRKIPILDELGHARHLLGVSIDITEHKQARDALRASHEELERRVAERTAELEHEIEERSRAERALAQTQEQLRQAQKMEAIGRLAGGVAHDFNNILSVILSYTTLSLRSLSTADPLHADLSEILRAGERASDLTRQLLAFSRRQILEPRIVDLNQVVTRLQQMLQRLIGEDIELDTKLGRSLHKVRVDRSQIEQVVVNLAVNARDAMPEGGRLSIETSNVVLDEQEAGRHLEVAPGNYVLLSVRDTGTGMDARTLELIFEPFFTTKDHGRGTGLGLSTVFGIVKQSGGIVSVDSEVGEGSNFRVYLPSVGRVSSASEPRFQAVVAAAGGETLLLVEDEEQVRRVVFRTLTSAGYQVLEAQSALEAASIGENLALKIDLLLTDVVMPQMSGPDLAKRLLSKRPGLRVLCMSGYTDDAVLRRGIAQAELAFIQKPITPQLLLNKVREVLDAIDAGST